MLARVKFCRRVNGEENKCYNSGIPSNEDRQVVECNVIGVHQVDRSDIIGIHQVDRSDVYKREVNEKSSEYRKPFVI
jgi:hypothetical protein